MFSKLYFWYYRKTNYVPHPNEMTSLGAGNEFKTYMNNRYRDRYKCMAFCYSCGDSLETIANEYNCTRERVRQCIWKYYREKTKQLKLQYDAGIVSVDKETLVEKSNRLLK